jgi:hypothetical protein
MKCVDDCYYRYLTWRGLEIYMFSQPDPPQDICTRFNEIHWHDSQLISFQLIPKGEASYEVHFDLRLLTNSQPGQYSWKPARLEIQDCRIFQLAVDTVGIRLTGGDIASAFCEGGPALEEKLESRPFDLRHEENAFEDVLHFRILLIHPGGEIDIFAKNFALKL